MNKLALYLQATGTTQEDFAALVGVDQSTISRLARGGRPGWDLAARIAQATDNAVSVLSWAPAEMRNAHGGDPLASNHPAHSGMSHDEGAA